MAMLSYLFQLQITEKVHFALTLAGYINLLDIIYSLLRDPKSLRNVSGVNICDDPI